MDKRMIITISFKDDEEEKYNFAKNQPNTSYYIKKLIEIDMKNSKKQPVKNEINDISEILEW